MNKPDMVAWLRAWAKKEREYARLSEEAWEFESADAQREYARGIEEAANEVEERLT